METRKEFELKAWAQTIMYAGGLIILAVLFLDRRSATVEWRAGHVVRKTWDIRNRGINDFLPLFDVNPPPEATCYIDVDIDGRQGTVRVDHWDYADFAKGQACEVAFRHGRFMDYTFDGIRHPGTVKRLPLF